MMVSRGGEDYILSRKDSMKMVDNIYTLITLWVYTVYCIQYVVPYNRSLRFSGFLAENEEL